MYTIRIFCAAVLLVTVAAEPPSGGYQDSSSLKGIRYAGPIVYTNEKPPVIHFPPPPAASTAKEFQGLPGSSSLSGKSVKYVPMPTHDLPILIYTSDVSPPLHVVPQPGQTAAAPSGLAPAPSSSYQSGSSTSNKYSSQSQSQSQGSYKNKAKGSFSGSSSSYSHSSSKPHSQSSKRPKGSHKSEGYKTVEYSYQPSHGKYTASASKSLDRLYDRMRTHTQSLRNLLQQSSNSLKSVISPSPSSSSSEFSGYSKGPRPKQQRERQQRPKKNYRADDAVGEYSTKDEVISKPKMKAPKQSSQPLPHIIYTGHAPIHIFNQSPVYVPKTQQTHASPKSTSREYQGDESAPKPSYAPSSSTSNRYRDRGSHSYPKKEQQQQTRYTSSNTNTRPKQPFYQSLFQGQESSYKKPSTRKPSSSYVSSTRSPYDPSYTSSSGSSSSGRYETRVKPSQSSYYSSSSSSSGTYPKSQLPSSSMSKKRTPKPKQSPYSYSSPKPSAYTKSGPSSQKQKQKQYSSAPDAFKKPPIIIYQGLYPPHHVFENSGISVSPAPGPPPSHSHSQPAINYRADTNVNQYEYQQPQSQPQVQPESSYNYEGSGSSQVQSQSYSITSRMSDSGVSMEQDPGLLPDIPAEKEYNHAHASQAAAPAPQMAVAYNGQGQPFVQGYSQPHPQSQALPTYYLPSFEYSAPAMYVSDLTSQGTTLSPAQYYVVPHQNGGINGGLGLASMGLGGQAQTIQIQNPDGTHSTAQVISTSTHTHAADTAAAASSHTHSPDSIIPTSFLASSFNNQNNPLTIPMSLSSIIVQSAGPQHSPQHQLPHQIQLQL